MTCRAHNSLARAHAAQRGPTWAQAASWASGSTTPSCTSASRELTLSPARRPGARRGRSAPTVPPP